MPRDPRPSAGHHPKPLRLARTTALAVIVSLPLAALPATAVAAQEENKPPSRPLTSEMSTGYDACVSGSERPYVPRAPELSAVIRDPDVPDWATIDVTTQFEVFWKDAAGETQRRRYEQTRHVFSDGRRFEVTPSGFPAHTVIGWRVRATDGTDWGPWSSSAGQGPCEFVHDDDRPEAPTVRSEEYPDDSTRHGGVGDYGRFTFDSPSDDTVAYRYSFIGGPYGATATAPEPGAAVTISWVPRRAAPNYVQVRALDRAGNSSSTVTHYFRVGPGRAPAGHWRLTDAAGADEAAAESGTRARAAAGVAFGADGPWGTDITASAALDGTADAHLTPGTSAVDTSRPFAMAAWVRPGAIDRDMTAVSQDGEGGTAAALGLNTGASGTDWSFSLPTASGPVRVEGGNPVAGRWSHLAGVYDPVEQTAQLFVNGAPVAAAEDVAAQATGALQIGRTGSADGRTGHWSGALADVRVWDRVVFAERLTELAHREAERKGYWQLNESAEGRSPEYAGGPALVLGGDARVPLPDCAPDDIFCTPDALVGTSHLELDGAGDHAATDLPVVDSDGSFTLAARVRLASNEPERNMTVLSLPGDRGSALTLRYAAGTRSWELAVSASDDVAAEVTTLAERAVRPADVQGEHLTVTYDASQARLRLYVDGYLRAETEADLWTATGGLQVGRSLTADGWGEHLAGTVDEVRAYRGALTSDVIDFISFPWEVPNL